MYIRFAAPLHSLCQTVPGAAQQSYRALHFFPAERRGASIDPTLNKMPVGIEQNMDLSYSEEQTMLRDSAERFLSEQYDFAARQRIAASAEGYSDEIWRELAGMGWLALPLPESAGGLGGGAVDTGIVMEACGKALFLEPYLATVILGAGLLTASGDAKWSAELLPAVAAGTLRLAFAHSESGLGLASRTLATSAQRSGNGWTLNGIKHTVIGATAADQLIVSARVGSGAGLFLVPRAADGVTLVPYPLVDGTRAADVILTDVTVAGDALLAGNDSAWPVIDAVIDRAIAALAADAVGATRVLLDATAEYTKTRVQFGQPLARFQALQHRMAEMAVLQEEAAATALFATLMADASAFERARAASAAKVKVARAAHTIGQQAIQLHGAMGVTEELSVGAYFKRVLVFEHLFGSVDEHLHRYGTLARQTGFIGRGLIERGTELEGQAA